MPTAPQFSRSLLPARAWSRSEVPINNTRGLTLVEAMIALMLLGLCLLGFLGTFLQSRKSTENAILHEAATNIVYGILEQIKDLDYDSMLPCGEVDPADAESTPAPNLRVQINQNTIKWLTVKYTAAPDTPLAPLSTPDPYASAASVGGGAIDNVIGPLPLSSAASTQSQGITLHLWIWIDEIPDSTRDVSDVKRITLVYTYNFNSGSSIRPIRNREVILRTRYNK